MSSGHELRADHALKQKLKRAERGGEADPELLDALRKHIAKRPLHARLLCYQYRDPRELLILRAMIDKSPDGSHMTSSMSRIEAFSKIPKRDVQRIVNGYKIGGKYTRRDGEYVPGLVDLRVLNKQDRGKRGDTGIFSLNEVMLDLDPNAIPYLARELQAELFPEKHSHPMQHAAWGTGESDQSPHAARCTPFAEPMQHAAPLGMQHAAPDSKTFLYSNSKATNSDAVDARARVSDVDKVKVRKAILEVVEFVDDRAVDLIVKGCLRNCPDAKTDEITYFVRLEGATVVSGRIDSPVGFLIATVPDCFAGEAFREWRNNRRAAAAEVQALATACVPGGPRTETAAAVVLAEANQRPAWGDADPWLEILRRVEPKINRHSFDTWLKPTKGSHVKDGVLFVQVPTQEFCSLAQRYGDLISQALRELGLPYSRVEFMEFR